MAMLDSFFGNSFKISKCKTLLKLTIPRIKLLRNRREIQIKQMRREIAKLLETGQEATARIRVEHILREEKMVAAQEIVELFSELITARLPIIEAQKECPLDLKEAISSLCFAAPRCADLPELQEARNLFAAKYGKEFVYAASELLPECGVNRQLIELLSVRAPAPDVILKLLKEIAEEHELDWNPSASESELLKPHEDLLNGPTQAISMSEMPIPKEEHDETNHSDFDEEDYEIVDFPEVPSQPVVQPNNKLRPSAPEMLPFPVSAFSEDEDEDEENQNLSHSEPENAEDKKQQFVPFIYPPPLQDQPPPNDDVHLQDVLAAAQTAADAAEHAAEAARSAASIAQLRINEIVKKNNDNDSVVDDDASGTSDENPFHLEKPKSDSVENDGLDSYMTHQPMSKPSYDDAEGDLTFDSYPKSSNEVYSNAGFHQPQKFQDDDGYFSKPLYDDGDFKDLNFDSSPKRDSYPKSSNDAYSHVSFHQRLQSLDDEDGDFSYPDLFTSQRQNPSVQSFTDSK